jgi:tetratricopeptide (TPR) repeat protein
LTRAYRATGDMDQTIVWYEKVVGQTDNPLGWEPQQDWLAAHYHLARAYLARGQKSKAAVKLDQLLSLWKDADPDLTPLRKVKAESDRLKLEARESK